MLKILYAAGNNANALIQLSRFLKAIKGKPYIVKIAAYKQSSPNINIDWTLNCLLNIYKPEHISFDSDNFLTYFEQVKYFNPDLVISDMEYFTSYIANVLDITLWQCSSSLINFAVQEKYNLGLFKQYSYVINRNPVHYQRMINIIDNSNYNFVYSHFGDMETPPALKNNFEWIRPYHSIGKDYIPCKHNIIAGLLNSNKSIYKLLTKYSDSVAFTKFTEEKYKNLILKDIENQQEYFCNLKNSNLFICEGQTSFLADAFYNDKYSVVMINFNDIECIINGVFSERFNLSTSIYETNNNLNDYMNNKISHSYNDIKYLHERLDEV